MALHLFVSNCSCRQCNSTPVAVMNQMLPLEYVICLGSECIEEKK
jgi:hypothetical protein